MRRLAVPLPLLLALVAPGPIAGQDGVRLEVLPHAGWSVSNGELGRLVRNEDGSHLVFGRPGSSAALGTVIRMGWGDSPWGVRATVLRSLGADLRATHECARGEVCPAVLRAAAGRATLTAATLAVERGLSSLFGDRVLPYVILGAGVRAYGISWERNTWLQAGETSDAGFALQVGAGAEWEWRGLALVAEVDDVVSRIGDGSSGGRPRPGDPPPSADEGRRTLHQLSFSLGAKFRLF